MAQLPSLSHQRHRDIDKDHRKAAKAAHLVYVTNKQDGILRKKSGKGFYYSYKGKQVKDTETLQRIKKLAIPPSWKDAWICAHPSGHIQATGTDLNGRKQYRYHSQWNQLRNETKFHRLLEFGKALPQLRKRTKKDLASKELTAEKVLAAAIRLMEETCIRVGNNGYEKLYGSYGLTTLKDKHVSIKNDKAFFSFTGKKGIDQEITLKNKQLARILKQCRDIPGKELLQYYTADGQHRTIDSGMVNQYIKDATGDDFSAKDFRTWAGSLLAVEFLVQETEAKTAKDIKQNVVKVLDEVSSKLGNTRNICKKYYVHPLLISLYEENKLAPYFNERPHNLAGKSRANAGLSENEAILLKVLESHK